MQTCPTTTPTTTPESSHLSNLSPVEIAEMDFFEIMEVPLVQMSEQQVRALIQTCQEERTIPTVRAAKARRKSEELSGKSPRKAKVQLDMNDLF